ncbi:STAS domain-containing protein [Nocardia sp. CDC159]|uniref:Anti-sigma factor antagonist n=1 Tax=Nocardia pulmonis TaxID=2951408 RepID=A0A9X2E2Y2_9NOCA|nr:MULTISPECIES: STAS domain-containing protein [Nocardia]MCM6772128.1 STAS domain-containing protein [Nocardia pulmonis]MCM6785214.1 STAS domain-containing protein [Nocardia sp. CDC159]
MSAIAVLHRRIDTNSDEADGPPEAPVRQRRLCTIVRVEGELDATVADDFHAALGQAVTTSARAVVIDLRPTRFLSIGSAQALVAAKQSAAACGVDLRMVSGRREIERVLDVTGLRPLFRYYPSVQAALEA